MNERLRRFLFPEITPRYLLRVALVALGAYVFFGHVCTPFAIRGHSMEPTYADGGFNFIWRPAFAFAGPRRLDVVAVKLSGTKVVLLKRVVALAGDTVEFRLGALFVNGSKVAEPYVQGPCTWTLPPRRVGPGKVYLVGDNRSMPMEAHDFGQTSRTRLVGSPLW